ncbi:hypothetical protein C6500_17280 [Candidatus Poribacteria bacterium]|nr:MAG: hypothetical protein C6500_17280 [Candidatus Poribacteria bacterium]
MRTILALSILFCVFASPTFAELTDADLNKIRLIVTEEIQKEIKPIKADIATLKADIATLKTDMALMKIEVANLKQNVNDRFTSVNDRFDDIQKNFDRQNNIIIACIGIPLVILAIGATVWGILANKRSGNNREQERINQELREEIEALKQQLIRP